MALLLPNSNPQTGKLRLTTSRGLAILRHMPNYSIQPTQLFAALGDATRLAVVQQLCAGNESVSHLAAAHNMALPSFLQHIRVLEKSGWILTAKVGRVRTCAVNPQALALTGHWLQQQRLLWEQRLTQLDEYLITLQKEETNASEEF